MCVCVSFCVSAQYVLRVILQFCVVMCLCVRGVCEKNLSKVVCFVVWKCLFESFCVSAQYVLRHIYSSFVFALYVRFYTRVCIEKYARDCVFCGVYVFV